MSSTSFEAHYKCIFRPLSFEEVLQMTAQSQELKAQKSANASTGVVLSLHRLSVSKGCCLPGKPTYLHIALLTLRHGRLYNTQWTRRLRGQLTRVSTSCTVCSTMHRTGYTKCYTAKIHYSTHPPFSNQGLR